MSRNRTLFFYIHTALPKNDTSRNQPHVQTNGVFRLEVSITTHKTTGLEQTPETQWLRTVEADTETQCPLSQYN